MLVSGSQGMMEHFKALLLLDRILLLRRQGILWKDHGEACAIDEIKDESVILGSATEDHTSSVDMIDERDVPSCVLGHVQVRLDFAMAGLDHVAGVRDTRVFWCGLLEFMEEFPLLRDRKLGEWFAVHQRPNCLQ